MAYVEFIESTKTYGTGSAKTVANDKISFSIEKGEFVVIVGPSGAGKSTILNILGGMDTNDSGQVLVDGKDIAAFSDRELTTYRRKDVGFVFQFYNLIPNLTALENVELANAIVDDALDAEMILERVGLGERMNNFPSQLSGGEQQRVAIARALGKIPSSFSATSPPGLWITRPEIRCSFFWRKAVANTTTPSSSLPTIGPSPMRRTVSSRSATPRCGPCI